MKQHLAMVTVGGICLPLTYHANRGGEWLVSVLIIAAVAALGHFLAAKLGPLRLFASIGFFALGALVIEVAFYLFYYFTYGHSDPSLAVGQAVTAVEFAFIAGVGVVAIVASSMATRRITTRWSGP